jgi:hypothetical protein
MPKIRLELDHDLARSYLAPWFRERLDITPWLAPVAAALEKALGGPVKPCTLCQAGVPINGAVDGRPSHVIYVAGDPTRPQAFYLACEVTS